MSPLSTHEGQPLGVEVRFSLCQGGFTKDLVLEMTMCWFTVSVCAPPSDRKLRSAAAAVGQQQQASQAQTCEWVTPQERWRAAKHSFHSVPSHATLPSGLFVFKTLNLLQSIETKTDCHRFLFKVILSTAFWMDVKSQKAPSQYFSLSHTLMTVSHGYKQNLLNVY